MKLCKRVINFTLYKKKKKVIVLKEYKRFLKFVVFYFLVKIIIKSKSKSFSEKPSNGSNEQLLNTLLFLFIQQSDINGRNGGDVISIRSRFLAEFPVNCSTLNVEGDRE